jgi:hypothetical protein
MACNNCTSTAPLTTFDVQYFYSNQCFDCGSDACTGKINNAKCIVYTGPNLSCSGINTNDSLETALQKIDEQICAIVGDYSTYQFNCLPAWYGAAITTEAEFVDAITGYACETRGNLDTFISTTYPADQTIIDDRLIALEVPGITCVVAGVIPTDTLVQVLNKYCTAFSSISIDLSGVVWDNCLAVITPPTTVVEGFQLLADQICLVNSGYSLPTINNIGTCLATPGATDSIVATIGKITDYMCDLPTFDVGSVTWGCVSSQIDLQTTIEELVAQATARILEVPTYSGDFTITQVDGMDPCAGINVALTTPLNLDRFVAVSVGDATPGTLIDKVASSGSTLTITNDADTTLNIEIANGDKGDITVTGNSWVIDNDAVTYAKMQNMTTNRLLGRSTGGSGDVEELQVGTGLAISGGQLTVDIESGLYTPTLTGLANVTSTTAYECQYMRVGTVVTVSGRFRITFTTITTVTDLGISLPIAANFSAEGQCAGVAASNDIANGSFPIRASTATDEADFYAIAPGTALSEIYWFTFTYSIPAAP